jgi:hypothetical protein
VPVILKDRVRIRNGTNHQSPSGYHDGSLNVITTILGRSEELVLKNGRTAQEPMVLSWVFHENLRFFEFSKRPQLEIL